MMASKLMNFGGRSRLLFSMLRQFTCMPCRQSWHLIPPDQYDSALSKRLRLGHALSHNWEIIPLFLTTLTSMGLLVFAIVWSVKNKVDVVYKTHSRDNISRTMDLRCPTIHKLVTVNQVYEPWPKLQDVLDKCANKESILKQLACACIKDKARKQDELRRKKK